MSWKLFEGSTVMLPDFRLRQREYLLRISQAMSAKLDLDVLLKLILEGYMLENALISASFNRSSYGGLVITVAPFGGYSLKKSFLRMEILSCKPASSKFC